MSADRGHEPAPRPRAFSDGGLEPAALARWRGQLDALASVLQSQSPTDEELERLALADIDLRVLEAMHARVALGASLPATALAMKAAQFRRALSDVAVTVGGYYSLASPDPLRDHNKRPLGPPLARGSIETLLSELTDDDLRWHDQLASEVLDISNDAKRVD